MQGIEPHTTPTHPLSAFTAFASWVRAMFTFEPASFDAVQRRSVFLTVLAALGATCGLFIAALLSHDPREAGAYAVACVMIGGAMAANVRTNTAHRHLVRATDHVEDDRVVETQDTCSEHHWARQEMESVAHDLRAPLLSISSYVDLVASGAFGSIPDEAVHALRRAGLLSERAQTVVATTLIATTTGPATARAIPLEQTLAEVATALTPMLRERDASMTVSMTGKSTLPQVMGDEAALFRVFENLVQNAIKYCPAGRTPRVTVEARRLDGRTVEIVVSDNGDGLPGTDHAGNSLALTQRGVRGANAMGIPGHGLGLATVARLVSRMNGTLTFESDAGGGTRARITLPAA